MNHIASEAFRLCRRCNDMEAEMRQELIKMLESQENKRVSVKDNEGINDDDVVLTLYDEGNYSYTMRVRAIELDGDGIFMVGDLDGDPNHYWQAFGIDHYYWCLWFIYINMDKDEKE